MIKCLGRIEQAGMAMRTGRFLTIVAIFVVGSSISSMAQRPRKPAPKPVTANPVISAAKQQVANQLYNVNIFIDKLGPIAVAIENTDKQVSDRRLSRADAEANEVNKQKLIAAIRGLRQGLVALETDFRTKAQLSPYLARIQGIGALSAQAEDSALAGRFVASKDPLRQVAAKLNDTFAVLPGPVAADSRPFGGRSPALVDSGESLPVSNQIISAPVNRPEVRSAPMARREIALGMTPAEVLASTWGAPVSKRTSTSANGTTEVWSYRGNRTVYFFRGKASRIVP